MSKFDFRQAAPTPNQYPDGLNPKSPLGLGFEYGFISTIEGDSLRESLKDLDPVLAAREDFTEGRKFGEINGTLGAALVSQEIAVEEMQA